MRAALARRLTRHLAYRLADLATLAVVIWSVTALLHALGDRGIDLTPLAVLAWLMFLTGYGRLYRRVSALERTLTTAVTTQSSIINHGTVMDGIVSERLEAQAESIRIIAKRLGMTTVIPVARKDLN